ncbi:hypothetical protein [Rubrivirga sp. IMCC43871]|uniref:hypothetical protein n=1 Tax=Rubrivirga sp. IMCC43871 TaxID=3391575 RepID=UPI00398FC5DC
MTLADLASESEGTEVCLSLERLRHWDYEGMWHILIQARNGRTAGGAEGFVDPNKLGEWGDSLAALGIGHDDEAEAVMDLGVRGGLPHKLRIQAAVRGGKGNVPHARIDFESDDYDESKGATTQLVFWCEVKELNRLGRAVRWWSEAGETPLVWTPAP